ncbi:MAG: hypothetical protein AMJ73_04310, partial [candidate division Zixibacteria bacterium SM1_73]
MRFKTIFRRLVVPALLLLSGILLLLGIITPFDIISAERRRIAAMEQEMNLINREIKTLQGDTETHKLHEPEKVAKPQERLRPLQDRLVGLRVDYQKSKQAESRSFFTIMEKILGLLASLVSVVAAYIGLK